jgi:putative endonuclease
MPVDTSARGRSGEAAAERFLERAGMTIIGRNFRAERGEIDLIAEDGGDVVFVEVKTWSRYGIENLEFSISEKKQRKIIETAKFFLSKYRKYSGMRIRFDVVFIAPEGAPVHLVSAFSEHV